MSLSAGTTYNSVFLSVDSFRRFSSAILVRLRMEEDYFKILETNGRIGVALVVIALGRSLRIARGGLT